MSVSRYSRAMIWLHWLTALLVLVLFVVGYVAARVLDFGSPLKQPLFQLHAVLGYTLLLLTVLRLYAKWRTPQPAPPEGLAGLRLLLYRAVHGLLYLSLFLMALTGPGILWQSGLGLSPLFDPHGLVFDVLAAVVHVNFKWVFAGLIAVHILGVVAHQVTQGHVLSRMGGGETDATAACLAMVEAKGEPPGVRVPGGGVLGYSPRPSRPNVLVGILEGGVVCPVPRAW